MSRLARFESLLTRATRRFSWDDHVGGASLGWLSPVVVRDVEVRDADGKPLATLPLVTSSKTLLALLLSPRDLGSSRIERPQIDVFVRDTGSNIEDAMRRPEAPDRQAPSAFGTIARDRRGIARIDDVTGGRQWQIDEFACDVTVPHDDANRWS